MYFFFFTKTNLYFNIFRIPINQWLWWRSSPAACESTKTLKSHSNAICTSRQCSCVLLCLLKHNVRSLVLLSYLLGQLGVECCVGAAPYHSAYFAEAFLCSQSFCFPNIVCSCSSLRFLTPPFLFQLWFADASENNQQTQFLWPVYLISCCLPSCGSLCSSWGSMFL